MVVADAFIGLSRLMIFDKLGKHILISKCSLIYLFMFPDNMQTRVDPFNDTIYVKGCRLSKKLPPKLYFALNKPKG